MSELGSRFGIQALRLEELNTSRERSFHPFKIQPPLKRGVGGIDAQKVRAYCGGTHRRSRSAIASFSRWRPSSPILLLTAKDELAAQVAGFKAGADDYSNPI